MSASKLNPNSWQGQERDGGYIARNKKPTSTSSPQWRGKLYIVGVGWYWVSAWEHGSKADPVLALRVQEMTDEHAAKFCKPKPVTRSKPPPRERQTDWAEPPNGADPSGTDIPF